MGEKNKQSNGEQQQRKEGAESTKKESGGNKVTVLKADLHCEGCVTKVMKCIRTIDGVDTANIGDGQITVVGKVDPEKLRERVAKKTHKKIELVSPQKNNKNGDGKEKTKGKEGGAGGGGAGDAKKEEKNKESHDKNSSQKSGEKKPKEKEPQVTTAVLKVQLHCEGCIHKIRRIVTRTKGYRDMKVDKQKETVTVTGALDMKALAEELKKHVKRDVQIVPAKKEAEKKEDPGGAKAKGGDKGKNGGDNGKKGGGGGEKAAGGEKMEGNKVQFQVAYPNPHPYPYPMVYESGLAMDQFHYNPYAYGPNQAPQLFSDENPNACSIM